MNASSFVTTFTVVESIAMTTQMGTCGTHTQSSLYVLEIMKANNHCHFELSYPNGSGVDSDSDIGDPLEFAEGVRNPSTGMHNYD